MGIPTETSERLSPSVTGTVRRALRHDRWALAGAVTIGLLGLLAAGADVLCAIEGQDPYTYDTGALDPSTGAPPGSFGGAGGAHWFGVEPLTGRDLFAIVAHGARTSLLIGLAATAVSVALGVVLGMVAGYRGGWTDRLVSRTADVMFGFPYLIFMIALGAVTPLSFPRPLLLILLLGFFGWPRVARVVRAQTLTLRRRTFVSASRVMGASTGQVLRRQILPNLLVPIIVVATLLVPERIGAEAALSFLGAGIPPPRPSWGRSIGDAVDWVSTDPMFLLFPGGALFLATLALNLLGDGLRDAFDPRMTILTGGRR
ncbi:ABC transporter permease [Dactylosporangium vinaceum]|uniref:ABC transporter permease n=1 Tax=Dactylosporangium vinaceum TaxID=53362 RepID=A0ABV5M3R4_9ACTN|nr:ABC transporter permease [Dactylosporangium vinaceum]UAB94466.1 ABC transporter permease [Dactylosporangium vinaceum]